MCSQSIRKALSYWPHVRKNTSEAWLKDHSVHC
jgi:hypothetical protein